MIRSRLFLLAAALPWLAGCGECGKPAAAPKPAARAESAPTPARHLALTRTTDHAAVASPATVRAARRAELAPRIAGIWSEVFVSVGDTVAAGAPLARVHAPEWSARRDAAEAAETAAQADFTRTDRLRRADAATPAELEAATARLRTAEAALAEARAMANETTLTAPFAGTIAAKHATVGDAALPGRPALVLEDPTSLEIEAALPESLAPAPRPGDRLAAELRGVALDLTLTEVTPAADPLTRTRTVRAALTPEVLKKLPAPPAAGEFARVFPTGAHTGESRPVAPADAIVRRGQLEAVWVRVDGKAVLRLVRTGRPVAPAGVEILSGLAGDETLLAPAPELRDGARVE